jgi:serine/threonine protein kinase
MHCVCARACVCLCVCVRACVGSLLQSTNIDMSFLFLQIQVAIKCLSRERMQNNPIEFLKEAAIMHAIDHEHIVRLYGVVLDTNALMLV